MLLGSMLYWAEGSKEKEYFPGTGVVFGNSDVNMIKIYLKWLTECLLVTEDEIVFGIYVHESYKNRIKDLCRFWSEVIGFSVDFF